MAKEIKISWKKDSVAGCCEITGHRTQWIAHTEHGWIRCFREANITDFETVIWNKIINDKIKALPRPLNEPSRVEFNNFLKEVK